MHAIVEVEPRRPSDVVAQPETREALTLHAARCGTTAGRLRRMLRGDLDTIVAKTLKKNSAERYASVTALADDLRRFLRQEPIAARPDTLRYRAVTFVRRHARGVPRRPPSSCCSRRSPPTTPCGSRRSVTVRSVKRPKRGRRAKCSTGLLTAADPYEIGGSDDPTIRGVLDAGAEQVQKELAGQPDLQAGMLTLFGRIYRRLGVYDKAQPLLEQALVSGHAAFGAEHVDLAQTLQDLGTVLADKGDYAAAAERFEQALAMRRKLLGQRATRTSPSRCRSSDASTRISGSTSEPSHCTGKR